MEGKLIVDALRIFKKLGPMLFLLWLLFVNILYYAQFGELAVSRFPWLAHLWR
jgi:hypothetical protein